MQKRNWLNGKLNLEELALLGREKLSHSGLVIGKGQGLAIVVLIILVIAGCIVFYLKAQPRPVAVSRPESESQDNGKYKQAQVNKKDEQQLYVHVAGAVINPGVYRLKEGSRVMDAVSAAGGGLESADTGALNLAAKVSDGQKVYVPKKGESSPGDMSQVGNPGLPDGGKINLNTATLEQLDSLPGVGQVTAMKIIEYRNKCGSFKKIDDLKQVDGIGSKKFEQLKDRLCVE